MKRPVAFWVDLAVKAALLALLLVAVLFPDLPQFAIGFGMLSAIVWEVAEYFAFIRDSPELATAYTDTLGDLVLGTSGSVVAGLVPASLWRRLRGAAI